MRHTNLKVKLLRGINFSVSTQLANFLHEISGKQSTSVNRALGGGVLLYLFLLLTWGLIEIYTKFSFVVIAIKLQFTQITTCTLGRAAIVTQWYSTSLMAKR